MWLLRHINIHKIIHPCKHDVCFYEYLHGSESLQKFHDFPLANVASICQNIYVWFLETTTLWVYIKYVLGIRNVDKKSELEKTKRIPPLPVEEGTESWQDALEALERDEVLTMREIEQREKLRAQKKAAKKRRRRRRIVTVWFLVISGCMIGAILLFWVLKKTAPVVVDYAQETANEWKEEITEAQSETEEAQGKLKIWDMPEIDRQFITPNRYSRPGEPLLHVDNVFVHYTANPGTSAAQTRSYFNNQAVTHERSVSAHFVIGMEGEIIQCIPLDEIAYAVQKHNYNSISIECCYDSEDGSFRQETYDSLTRLLAWLVCKYELPIDAVQRHSDTCYKKCPKYYAEHDDKWNALKFDVLEYIKEHGSASVPDSYFGE